MATPESGLGRADAVLKRALEGVGLTLPKVLAGAAPQGATPRHVAPPSERSADKTNPMPRVTPQAPRPRPPRPLKPVQLTAARLLLQGQSVTAVASTLGVHRYTVARW